MSGWVFCKHVDVDEQENVYEDEYGDDDDDAMIMVLVVEDEEVMKRKCLLLLSHVLYIYTSYLK